MSMETESSDFKTDCSAVESQEMDCIDSTNNDKEKNIKVEVKEEPADMGEFLLLQIQEGCSENENTVKIEEKCAEEPEKEQYVRRSPRKRKLNKMFTTEEKNSRSPAIGKQNESKNQCDTIKKETSNSGSPNFDVLCLCPYCEKFTVVNTEHLYTDTEHTSTDVEHTSTHNLCNGHEDSVSKSGENDNELLDNKKQVISQCQYCYQTFVTTVEKDNDVHFKTSKIEKDLENFNEISVKKEILYDEGVSSIKTEDETTLNNNIDDTLPATEKYNFRILTESELKTTKNKRSRKVYKCPTCNKEFLGKYRIDRHELTHTRQKASKIKKDVEKSSEISVKEEMLYDEGSKNTQTQLEITNFNNVDDTLPATEEYSFRILSDSEINPNKKKKSRKVYKCPTCSKEFLGKYRLDRHQLTHTGYRPFKCSFCEMRFSVKDKVLRHERNIHNMDLPFQCSKCDKRFATDMECFEHEAIHKKDVKNPLECEICNKTFKKKYRRNEHMNRHLGIRPFKCRYCDKYFYAKERVTSHEVTHLENRPLFMCTHCDKMFVTEGGRREHEIIKHTGGKQGLTCDYCGKIFLSFWKLTTHLRTHTGDRPFKCSHCDKSFGAKHRLTAHENVHTGMCQYKCAQCDLSFLTSKRLKLHEKKHPLCLPYTCSYCGTKFGTRIQLSTHEITHYTVLPYLCEFCDKKFATEEELKEHDKTHIIEQQLPCSICGKLYNNKPSLTAHEKLHMEDRSGNQCSYCGLSCFNAKSLKIHELRHTGERPFKCRFCDKRYVTNNRCKMHEKTHNDEDWQYLCSICGKKFFSKSKVESHEFTHTGLRPHKCEECGVAFNKLYNLTAHYRVHNRNLATFFTCSFCDFRTSRKSLLNKHVQKHDSQFLNSLLSYKIAQD